MTLEFAVKEALRRTKVIGGTHFVVPSLIDVDSYMVLTDVPDRYQYVIAVS